MPLPANPLINGRFFDFASISIVTTFGRFSGVTDISYSDSVEVGSIYGTNRKRMGRTGGQVSVEASLTMEKHHLQEMIAQLGSFGLGYGAVPFDIVINYAELNMPVVTDILHNCRITGTADTASEGVDVLKVAVTLDVMDLTRNGLSIVARPAI